MTAGEKSLKAASDTTKYDSMELAYALNDDILKNIWDCIDYHYEIFDEPEFCIVMQLASDPVLTNLVRRKFYAWPYLPKPRPNQAVFLFQKHGSDIQRLWVLPCAQSMEVLAEATWVSKRWETMRMWSRWFYEGTFWKNIRNQCDIDLLSEEEYLKANIKELRDACGKDVATPSSDPFDFINIAAKQIIDA